MRCRCMNTIISLLAMTIPALPVAADVVTINIDKPGVIPAMPMALPTETFTITYITGPPPNALTRTETFTIQIAAADVANANAKSAAIVTKINNGNPRPANLTVTDLMGSVKIEATAPALITRVGLTQAPGRNAGGNQFALGERNILNPKDLILPGSMGLAGLLDFMGNGLGGGTAVTSITGPGGSLNDIVLSTMSGESGSGLAARMASEIRSKTSFDAYADGSLVYIPGLTNLNLFGGELTDGGYDEYTISLLAIPEPSPLVLGTILGLGFLVTRRRRRQGSDSKV